MDERDDIDELVDAQLDSFYFTSQRQSIPRCPHKCGGEWHGIPNAVCKGVTVDEIMDRHAQDQRGTAHKV